jgi:hypothetical protein
MAGAGNGQELGQAFDYAENQRLEQEEVIHGAGFQEGVGTGANSSSRGLRFSG